MVIIILPTPLDMSRTQPLQVQRHCLQEEEEREEEEATEGWWVDGRGACRAAFNMEGEGAERGEVARDA